MISFIIEMPTEEDGHSRAHKFPFVASEIFNSSEAEAIFRHFFQEEVRAPIMKIQLKQKLQTKEKSEDKSEETNDEKVN